ncbi:MAG: hypothetical protein WBE76_27665 [Terracidiphilus sp.]
MPSVEFPYLSYSIPPSNPFPGGQTALRPITVAVLTTSAGNRLRCLVCLDSGADSCVLPSSFAPVLGLDLLSMKRNFTAGIGSSANPTAYETIVIDLGNGICFSSYVGFTPGLNALGIGLLGQAGFFEQFDVCFDYSGHKFTIATK